MISTNTHPDGLNLPILNVTERRVSAEIASTEVTTALLDGSARQRRDLRILARRLNGITARYGVTLEEAIKQAQAADRPVVVTLGLAESAVEPVTVQTPAPAVPIESAPAPAVERTTAVVSSPVVRTVAGHHFAFSDPRNEDSDHVCRSCGASGLYGYALDRTPCAAPYFGTESLGRVA